MNQRSPQEQAHYERCLRHLQAPPLPKKNKPQKRPKKADETVHFNLEDGSDTEEKFRHREKSTESRGSRPNWNEKLKEIRKWSREGKTLDKASQKLLDKERDRQRKKTALHKVTLKQKKEITKRCTESVMDVEARIHILEEENREMKKKVKDYEYKMKEHVALCEFTLGWTKAQEELKHLDYLERTNQLKYAKLDDAIWALDDYRITKERKEKRAKKTV